MTRFRWLYGKLILWSCRHRILSSLLWVFLCFLLVLGTVSLAEPGFFPWFVARIDQFLSLVVISTIGLTLSASIAVYLVRKGERHEDDDR